MAPIHGAMETPMTRNAQKAALAAAAILGAAAMAAPALAQHGGGWGGPGWGGPGRGQSLTLYSEPGLRGYSQTVTGTLTSLNQIGMNDRVGSLEARGAWEVCIHADFRGACRVYENTVAHLDVFAFQISSVRPVGRPGGGGWRPPGGGDDGPRWTGPSTEGRVTTFYPGRVGEAWGQGQRAAERFCRRQGHSGVAHFSEGPGGNLVDVLCRR